MSATVTTFLFEAANFLVLAAALGWLFFRPVRQAIAGYRDKVESEQRQAAETLAEAITVRKEIDEAHANLRAELSELRSKEIAAVRSQADQLMAEARADADSQREQGRLQASRISDSQRDRLAEASAAAAAKTIERLLEQIEGPELRAALIRSACEQLRHLSRESVAPVKIESDRPLSQEHVRQIKEALGTAADGAEFKTVGQMGIGVRISTANGLIDASVRGLSLFARQSLIREMQHRANHRHAMQAIIDE